MRLTRCFVPAALTADAALVLPEGASVHIAKVLRLRPGALLRLFDGRGGEFEARIQAIERGRVQVRVGAHCALERESPVAVTLLQCLARAERMDFIVQKATELGVAGIVPVRSEHSLMRLDAAGAQRRQQHWQAVTISACEQCGRNRVPSVSLPLGFESAVGAAAAPARLMLHPTAARTLAHALHALPATSTVTTLALLIGPEGGLSERELEYATQQGFLGCALGPRVLRAETAPLAALAAVQALLGDFAR